MYQFSQDLTNKLNGLNQRMLNKGEIFLLAKALADALPLMPAEEENVKLFILNHKRMIDEALWCLNTYSYMSEETMALIQKLIGDLTLWRAAVAYNPPAVLYRDDPNSVIDDISNLPRYVDIAHMCAVGDIINNANHMSSVFRDFVAAIKSQMASNGGDVAVAVAG